MRGVPFRARFWCAVRRFWSRFWCAVRRFWLGFWCTVCGAPILGPISVTVRRFWARFWVRRFWARFWCAVGRFRCTVCLFGVVFGVRSAVFRLHFGVRCVERRSWGRFRCTVRLFGFDFGAFAFLGSILVRGALMLGSITASRQQDLSKINIFFWRFVGHLLVDLKTS